MKKTDKKKVKRGTLKSGNKKKTSKGNKRRAGKGKWGERRGGKGKAKATKGGNKARRGKEHEEKRKAKKGNKNSKETFHRKDKKGKKSNRNNSDHDGKLKINNAIEPCGTALACLDTAVSYLKLLKGKVCEKQAPYSVQKHDKAKKVAMIQLLVSRWQIL